MNWKVRLRGVRACPAGCSTLVVPGVNRAVNLNYCANIALVLGKRSHKSSPRAAIEPIAYITFAQQQELDARTYSTRAHRQFMALFIELTCSSFSVWYFSLFAAGARTFAVGELRARAIEIFMGNKRILSLSLNYTVIDACVEVGVKLTASASS
jgi:hypothetical protein